MSKVSHLYSPLQVRVTKRANYSNWLKRRARRLSQTQSSSANTCRPRIKRITKSTSRLCSKDSVSFRAMIRLIHSGPLTIWKAGQTMTQQSFRFRQKVFKKTMKIHNDSRQCRCKKRCKTGHNYKTLLTLSSSRWCTRSSSQISSR